MVRSPLTGRAPDAHGPACRFNMVRFFWGLVASCVAAHALAQTPTPDGPVVTFDVEAGWVNFRVTSNGQDIANARMSVVVGDKIWAKGDTNEEGKGTFPVPPAESCLLMFEFDTGDTQPLPLSFLADGSVSPTRAMIRGALPSCCKPRAAVPPASTSVEPDAGLPPWWIQVGVLLASGVGLGWVYFRGTGTRATPRRTWEKRA
jgi:hypothetical protein